MCRMNLLLGQICRIFTPSRVSLNKRYVIPPVVNCVQGGLRYSRLLSAAAGASETVQQTSGLSFVERAKLYGANALLGAYLNSGSRFDRVLEGMTVTELSRGTITAHLPVTVAVSNAYGTLHGGATATAVDVIGTMALLTEEPTRPGVSVDLNITYVSAAKVGDTVVCIGRTLKPPGRTIGFTEVTLTSLATGKLVATGRHTKAL